MLITDCHCGYLPQHEKLNSVSECMDITMTVNGVNCNARVRESDLFCRIPKDMQIPKNGVPVQVKEPTSAAIFFLLYLELIFSLLLSNRCPIDFGFIYSIYISAAIRVVNVLAEVLAM